MAKSQKNTNSQQNVEQSHPVTIPAVKRPSQWRAFWALTKYATLAAARNKATLAFGFIFPVAFVSVFGLLGNSAPEIKLGIVQTTDDNNPVVQAISHIESVTIKRDDEATLTEQVKDGELNGMVAVTQSHTQGQAPAYTVTLLTSNNPSSAGAIQSLMQGVVDNVNLQLAGVQNPPISLTQEKVEGSGTRYIDFALPGQIGFALLSTAIFGTVFGFISLKRTLVLKRLFATPTNALTFLLAQGTSRLFWALLQTAVIVAVGVLAFNFFLPHGWLTFIEMLALSTVGLVAFLGFGYFMAGLSNDENSAGPVANLVTLPQMLLSGVFFPTDSFPDWVRPVADNLPLSYFNIAMREIASDGAHLIDVWPYMAGLLVWGGAMYLLATRTFKWE